MKLLHKKIISLVLTVLMICGIMPLNVTAQEAEHTHYYFATVTVPTCTEQGYTTYTCACGESYVGDLVDAIGEHSFSEWRVSKPATFAEEGEETRECIKCSHVEFRSIELSVVTSGNLGPGTTPTDKVKYTLYSDGTMVVEGEGALFGCYWDGRNQPFIEYRKEIKHLIISEGITQTTGGSFAHLTNLETVSFPSTIKKLQNNAFMNSFSESVTKITIPKNVVQLGAYSFGHYGGDTSAYFTDIIIENPNVVFTEDSNAIFNGGAKLDKLTLYSYGADNNVSAYAKKHNINYVDLYDYFSGEYSGIQYSYSGGVLVLNGVTYGATVFAKDQPWAEYIEKIKSIVIQDGISSIANDAFKNYPALCKIEFPNDLKAIGNGAFAMTSGSGSPLTLKIPKRLEFLGTNLFAGRESVNVTAYYGSLAGNIREPNVDLTLKKEFKLLLIGNSYSEDVSCCGQGMPDSQLFDILQSMLGEDAEVTVGAIISGGKGINWHATQAEQGTKTYYFKTISSDTKTWKTYNSVTSAEALAWTDWDAVSLQTYNPNPATGEESVSYPAQTDEKFYSLEAASEFMLDHIANYAPYADVYFYMHWSQTSSTVLNAALASYNRMAEYLPIVLDYEGTKTGKRFKDLIHVGLSIQNARTTYLALLSYNPTAYADKNLNLYTDAQIGLQRDGGHVSFNIGRYIAGLTFAEIIIPEEIRAENYVLPDIRITESIGKLPKEYTDIAQSAVFAAVESWKNESLAVTQIEGYEEDPTTAAKNLLSEAEIALCSVSEEMLKAEILALLPADFAVDNAALLDEAGEKFTADVTIRFGYTSVTVSVNCTRKTHTYDAIVTAPTCKDKGFTTYTCSCGESYVGDYTEATGIHTYSDGICTGCGLIRGDMNGDKNVDTDDAIYLLRHVLMPSSYPAAQNADVNGDGLIDTDDAIYLLRHVLLPESYPLK